MIPYSVMARLSVLFGLLFCLLPSLAQTDTPRFTEGDCPTPLAANGSVVCGTLTVPEDRSGDLNDTIDLAVVIYKATGSSPRPDPIVFLQGGPGGRSIATVALTYSLQFAPLNTEYDIIVMDQRGTGYSQPALACPQLN